MKAEYVAGVLKLYDIFQDGGWVIYASHIAVSLYTIPLYGGEEEFIGNYPNVIAALEVAKTFR